MTAFLLHGACVGAPPPAGAIVIWDEGPWTILDPGPFVQVSAGPTIVVGLRPDRSAIAWSFFTAPPGAYPQPGPFAYVIGSGPSEGRAFGILDDGSVIAWPSQPMSSPPPGPFVRGVANGWAVILQRPNGTLEGWGSTTHVWPLSADPFLSVDAGFQALVGVRPDGTLSSLYPGLGEPPAGTFSSVSVEYSVARHALALRPDGTIAAWGNPAYTLPVPPPGLFKAAEAGDVVFSLTWPLWALGIRKDGSLVTWGSPPPGVADVPEGKYEAIGSGWGFGVALAGCYADCNDDGSVTVSDFGCFQTRFVAGSPYVDCIGDGVLTVADFGCFQTQYVMGCP